MTTAGSFSGHLVDSYMATRPLTGPFGQPLNVSAHGPMSFAPSMHGSFNSSFSGNQSSFLSESLFMEMSEENVKKIAAMQAKLDKKLGPEYISQRPGPGGGPKLTYAEGWKIINLANEVFGFNGWSSSVVNITTDFVDYNEESRRYNVGVTAIVRVTLRDGVFHEDVGFGLLENAKSKGAALDKCKKEAVTDAVKRTLRNFGNLLGNCLYDKSYTQEVIKIKVPPPKFDRSELHRRPEFEEAKPTISTSAHASGSRNSSATGSSTNVQPPGPSNTSIKPDPGASMPPPNAPPRHDTSGAPQSMGNTSHVNIGFSARPNAISTPNAKGKAPAAPAGQPIGLHTPVQTPAGRAAQASGGDRMAQNLANKHAARMRQIQEAQEAQLKEEAARAQAASESEGATTGEKRVSFAQAEAGAAPARAAGTATGTESSIRASTSAPSRPSPPQVVHRSSETVPDADGDEYHFPSEDDAFLANLDLDALDEGIGRPIDFEEGAKPDVDASADVTVGEDGTASAGHTLQVAAAHPQQQQRVLPQGRQAQNVPGIRGERARTPSMGGGFSFPSNGTGSAVSGGSSARPPAAGQAQSNRYAQIRGATENVALSGSDGPSGISLKRSADVMQGYTAQQRRPAQGMGLQHAAAGGAHAGAKREPFTTLEVSDGGNVKRPRR